MIVRFPVVPDRYSTVWGNQLQTLLSRAFTSVVGKDEEAPRIVLRSPSGKLFDLTVDDAGALHTTATSKTRA